MSLSLNKNIDLGCLVAVQSNNEMYIVLNASNHDFLDDLVSVSVDYKIEVVNNGIWCEVFSGNAKPRLTTTESNNNENTTVTIDLNGIVNNLFVFNTDFQSLLNNLTNTIYRDNNTYAVIRVTYEESLCEIINDSPVTVKEDSGVLSYQLIYACWDCLDIIGISKYCPTNILELSKFLISSTSKDYLGMLMAQNQLLIPFINKQTFPSVEVVIMFNGKELTTVESEGPGIYYFDLKDYTQKREGTLFAYITSYGIAMQYFEPLEFSLPRECKIYEGIYFLSCLGSWQFFPIQKQISTTISNNSESFETYQPDSTKINKNYTQIFSKFKRNYLSPRLENNEENRRLINHFMGSTEYQMLVEGTYKKVEVTITSTEFDLTKKYIQIPLEIEFDELDVEIVNFF